MAPDETPLGQAMTRTLETEHTASETNGLGWFQLEQDGTSCWMHNGMTGGSSSFMAFCPEQELGIVILMNQQDLQFTLTQQGMKILDSFVQ